MILVTGATGTVGRELIANLLPLDVPVRALSRDPGRADLPAGIEVVTGDLSQPDTLGPALHGVDRVFMLSAGPDGPRHEANLIAAAQRADRPHIVKLSALSGEHQANDPITRWHLAGEKALLDSGLSWTFLRPGGFMSNALQWVGGIASQGTVYAPYGEGRSAVIDPADIAAVAAVILTQPGHVGRAYPLTGPEALSIGDQVQILSAVLGRPLQFIDVPPEAALVGMRRAGLSEEVADAALQSMAIALQPVAAKVEPTVHELTGRAPRTFTEWAQTHHAAFA